MYYDSFSIRALFQILWHHICLLPLFNFYIPVVTLTGLLPTYTALCYTQNSKIASYHEFPVSPVLSSITKQWSKVEIVLDQRKVLDRHNQDAFHQQLWFQKQTIITWHWIRILFKVLILKLVSPFSFSVD